MDSRIRVICEKTDHVPYLPMETKGSREMGKRKFILELQLAIVSPLARPTTNDKKDLFFFYFIFSIPTYTFTSSIFVTIISRRRNANTGENQIRRFSKFPVDARSSSESFFSSYLPSLLTKSYMYHCLHGAVTVVPRISSSLLGGVDMFVNAQYVQKERKLDASQENVKD